LALALVASRRALTEAEQVEFDRCIGSLSSQIMSGFSPLFQLGPNPAGLARLQALATAAESRPLTDQERKEFRDELAIQKAFVSKELETRVRDYWRQQDDMARARARLH
jgi:hypothetical protein